jgi:2-polyprenyl-6-methoxyphenol hydroxylase-like FAD-dependent oxidoreductase
VNEDVVIAGAGTTGLLLAVELGLAGISALVLEAGAGPRRTTPSAFLNPTCVELLDQRGLMDGLEGKYIASPRAHFAWLPLDTEPLNERYNIVINQAYVEEQLRESAAALGARISYGHRVTGVEQDGDRVTVSVTADGSAREITAGYLVACDGEDSAVRRSCAIGFPGSDRPFYGLVGDITVDFDELDEAHGGAYLNPGGSFYMGVPVGPDTFRVLTAEFGASPPKDAGEPTTQELQAQVLRLTGAPITVQETGWLARYGNSSRNAERYRDGRVFLCGDAAHTFFPLGGQRLNTCMQDAANLGWKLAAEIHGWAPPGLLDTYHAERHPVNERSRRTTAAQSELMAASASGTEELRDLFAEVVRFEQVNRYVLEYTTGLDVRYPMAAEGAAPGGRPEKAHPLLGLRPGPLAVAAADGETTLTALLRSGRGLLLDLSGGEQDLGDAAGWADRVDLVAARPTEALDASALLVRPDGHVAWVDTTNKDADGLRAALAAWFGAPSGSD